MSKKFASMFCVFVFAIGLMFSAVASWKTQSQSLPATSTPQGVNLIINEYLADPPAGAAGDANGDGTRDGTQDEFVELVNEGTAPLNIGLFTISDATTTRFTFPAGKVIPPGEAAVVFGGGTAIGSFGNAAVNGL